MKRKWFVSSLITLALIGSFFFGQQFNYEAAAQKSSTLWRCLLLKTGQTVSQVTGDDGDSQKGIANSYTVLTKAGNTNIDLAHYTSGAGAITFNNTLHTIVDTGNGLAIFKTNDVILTNSSNNPGPFTVTTGNVAGTITCTGATFVNETPVGTVIFYKREAHPNNCVLDNNTGLIWSQNISTKMGLASDGLLPWTTAAGGYGIFPYCTAANNASLAGYTDWRIPNRKELSSLINIGASPTINSTVFPSVLDTTQIWTNSSNISNQVLRADQVYFLRAAVDYDLKTSNYSVLLVRGG